MIKHYLIALLILTTTAAKIAGVSLLFVASGSMGSAISKGDIAVVVPTRKIQTRDMVMFRQGEKTIIHRITEIKRIGEQTLVQTKGDANEFQDPYPLSETEILGKIVLVIPSRSIIVSQNVPLLFWFLGNLLGFLISKVLVQKNIEF